MTNEEALELLKDTNLFLRCSFTGDIRIVEAMDMAIKALEGKDTNVPTKWIPVSERLPEEEGDYLVTDEAAGMAEVLNDKYICRDDGTWVWLYSQNAIAWMPLPEPYIEGENDGQE